MDEGTSGDVVAREGQDVSLSCRAAGRPLPRILWRREDGTNIQLRNEVGELKKVPPSIVVATKVIGVPTGSHTRLECFIEAYPQAVNYWLKGGEEMIFTGILARVRLSTVKDYGSAVKSSHGRQFCKDNNVSCVMYKDPCFMSRAVKTMPKPYYPESL
ncbi:unnamed protein product [Diatraea saccharalis]|uniref:Ig-like domain-containing protein n=1 Tax=Diatraea saccharalis TaxID=40085 RepID=A0A9N9R7A1_9NEOP|nr:unnamed protein product [Diatraea saccharalis]